MAKTEISTPAGTGHVNTLTPEQKELLKRMWANYFRVIDSGDANLAAETLSHIDTNNSSNALSTKSKDSSTGKKSWFGSNKSSNVHKENSQNDFTPTTKVASSNIGISADKIRPALWDAILGDHPDSVFLRFLRARKWNVHQGTNMLFKALKWRKDENVKELVSKNEVDLDAKYPGFLKQYQKDMFAIHGTDKQGHLLIYINFRLHKPVEQNFLTMQKAIVHIVENARLLTGESGKATLVADMTGFGLSNVDLPYVKFMIQTFESYYPESMGTLLVHKAPLFFWGVWKVIEPWFDPVVASKVRFTRSDKELAEYIDPSHIICKYEGGQDQFNFGYIPSDPNENSRMNDLEGKEHALEEWKAVHWKFEALTREWVNSKNSEDARPESVIEIERLKVSKDLREAYYKLDPYIRARTQYHRTSQPVISEDGSVNWVYKNNP